MKNNWILWILFVVPGLTAMAKGKRLMELETSPLIYNGTKSVEGEFPAMGWIGNCTATAIGPDVLYTASHCVTTGKRITFEHRGTGNDYKATCSRHPDYNTRTTYNDYALCKLDEKLPAGSVFATILEETPADGERLLLNGFGAPNVRVHYWGQATVKRTSGQDITTCGPANLGGGDSGGPLLKWTDDRTGKSGFQLIGVNSRGGGGCSYFNRNSHEEWKSWVRKYASDNGVEICGVNKQCSGSIPEPEPHTCWDLIETLTWCIGSADNHCKKAYESFKGCLKWR